MTTLGMLSSILLNAILAPSIFGYIGPGAAVTSIGVLLAIIAAVAIAIVGFLWYPIRRFLKKRKKTNEQQAESKTN